MNKKILCLLAATGLASTASAQLVQDSDLGTISGSTNLIGDTTGQPNNAGLYYDGTPIPGDTSNLLGFNAELGEFLYRFELSSDAILGIANNEGFFVGADNDHYLLTGLSVTPGHDVNGDLSFVVDAAHECIGFVDEEGSFGFIPAGVYWLSVDTYGLDAEGFYDIQLNVVDGVRPNSPPSGSQPTDFIDLGEIAMEGDFFTIDTNGSTFDTELGLYDAGGVLLEANDDGGDGLQSLVSSSDGATYSSLGEGDYFFAVGGFNTEYIEDFIVLGGSATGDIFGQANGVAFGPDFLDVGLAQFYKFSVGAGGGGTCPGDFADSSGFGPPDNQVDFGDFFALSFLSGPCPGGVPGCTGDLADSSGFGASDGMVDFGDFFALSFLAGPCP